MPGESILQTLQKIATAVHRLDALAEDLRELRTTGLPGWKLPAMLTAHRCKPT